MTDRTLISRHRLPQPYRGALAALWLAPSALLLAALVIGHGMTPAMFDPRLLLPLLLLNLPALYFWSEGIDVWDDGIMRCAHLPRYYAYHQLDAWHFDPRPDHRVLTLWDTRHRKVIECRAGHLTDLPLLLAALERNLSQGQC